VRFVDGASDVVALGTCFYGHGELSPTGTPANAPGHFLTNLAGSNKTLIVKKITVVSTWGVRLYIDPVAKAGGTAGINKKWGGAASVAAKVGASDDDPTTTMLGWTRVYTLAGSLATPSVGIQIIKFDEPIRLPPNTALHVKAIAGSGSTYIDANFEWTEE
jgi:hypothetical protein